MRQTRAAVKLVLYSEEVAPIIRDLDKFGKSVIEAVTVPANEQIARARFAVYGKTAHPDANFTLRLSFGKVKGYPMNGTMAPLQDDALRRLRSRPRQRVAA